MLASLLLQLSLLLLPSQLFPIFLHLLVVPGGVPAESRQNHSKDTALHGRDTFTLEAIPQNKVNDDSPVLKNIQIEEQKKL
jgi:hypothetical protein